MARRDALQLGLNRKDGSGHVLGAGTARRPGTACSMITVEAGFEAAVAAALGAASDAVVVQDAGAAAAAVRLLKDDDAGRAVAAARRRPGRTSAARRLHRPVPLASAGAPAGAALGRRPGSGREAGRRRRCRLPALLAGIAVVDGPRRRRRSLIAARPELTAVTRAGDVFTAVTVTRRLREGAVAARSPGRRRRRRGTAGRRHRRAGTEPLRAGRRPGPAGRGPGPRGRRPGETPRFGRPARGRRRTAGPPQLRAAQRRRRKRTAAASLAKAEANIVGEQEALEAVAARLAAAQEAPAEAGTLRRSTATPWPWPPRWPVTPKWRPGSPCAARRNSSRPPATGRPSLERAAATERRAREEAAERARRRRLQARRAAAVSAAVEQAIGFHRRVRRAGPAGSATAPRSAASRWTANLPEVRTGNDALARELAELTDSVHRDELARAQQRLRIEALELGAWRNSG